MKRSRRRTGGEERSRRRRRRRRNLEEIKQPNLKGWGTNASNIQQEIEKAKEGRAKKSKFLLKLILS